MSDKMPSLKTILWTRKVLYFSQRVRRLEKLMRKLESEPHKDRCPSEKLLKKVDIEFSDLDIKTGEVSPDVIPFFMPSKDDTIRLSKARMNTYKDIYSRWKKKKGEDPGDDFGPSFWAFMAYTENDAEFRLDMCHTECEEVPKSPHPLCSMGRATKTARKRQSHRSVSMLYNQLEDESRPSTCELTVLVGWMLKAMYEQEEHMPEKPKKKKPWSSHLVFPTSMLSFTKDGRLRVLYSYLDGNKLRVQVSKFEDLNGPGDVDIMTCALRWSFPILNRDTRVTTALPTIHEDEDTLDENCNENPTHTADGSP